MSDVHVDVLRLQLCAEKRAPTIALFSANPTVRSMY
jgi:hypothetical protein